jgi:hypothetical protein
MMKTLSRRGEAIPIEHAVHIVIDAAAGLHFAHEKKGADGRSLGIVHRDLSPSNIVVTYAGGIKVVDFGVAKIATDPELSKRYSLKGKLAYMSPEQVAHGSVDQRSDVFSLGIVLYELTVRKRLFKAASEVETLKLVAEAEVTKPSAIIPDFPPRLEEIVMRALARSPERRYQTARELQLDLEGFARDQKIQISSAALAEWMEATFGPKREIWHTLPALPPAAGGPGAAPVENTAATRRVAHAELAAASELAAARPRPRRMALVMAAAMLVVLLIGGGAFALRRRAAIEPRFQGGPASRGGAAVLVVAENGSVAIEQGASLSPAGAAPAAAPAAAAPVETVAAKPDPRAIPASAFRSSRAARPHRAAGPEDLSSALARREADIRRCFAAVGANDVSGSEISLRFEVAADGAVKSLAVLPPAIGATPLGDCIAKVGRSTTFAPRPAPITFRIPLTVQLRRQERGR